MSFLKQFQNPKKVISFEEYASYIYKNYDEKLDKLGEYNRYKKFYHQLCQGKNPINCLAMLFGMDWFFYRRMVVPTIAFFLLSVVEITSLCIAILLNPLESSKILSLEDSLFSWQLLISHIIVGLYGMRLHWNWLHYKVQNKVSIATGPSLLGAILFPIFFIGLAVLVFGGLPSLAQSIYVIIKGAA